MSIDGKWNLTIKGHAGTETTTLTLVTKKGVLTGEQTGQGVTTAIIDAKLDGANITWTNQITKPLKMKVVFAGVVEGQQIIGKCKPGFLPKCPFTAVKA